VSAGDLTVEEGVPYAETATITIAGVTAATTGYTSVIVIARNGVEVLRLTEGSGLTTTAGTDQVSIVIQMTAAQTAAFTFARADYQLDLLLSGSVVIRVLHASVLVERDVLA
jgi:hypothetical protein